MHHFASQIIDLLLVFLAAWMVLAIIFPIYAYLARLKYPVSESVFGRVVVVSFFIITPVDLAPEYCGRHRPIGDRSCVVPHQGRTTQVASKKRTPPEGEAAARNATGGAELERYLAKQKGAAMRAFLVLLIIAATNITTIAAAAEWRPQFLLGCRSGCTEQGDLSADVCLQICNCAASEMEANFGNEPLGSIGVPSAEQLSRADQIKLLCVRRVLGR